MIGRPLNTIQGAFLYIKPFRFILDNQAVTRAPGTAFDTRPDKPMLHFLLKRAVITVV